MAEKNNLGWSNLKVFLMLARSSSDELKEYFTVDVCPELNIELNY